MLKLTQALTALGTSLANGASALLGSTVLNWKTIGLSAAAVAVAATAIYLTTVAA